MLDNYSKNRRGKKWLNKRAKVLIIYLYLQEMYASHTWCMRERGVDVRCFFHPKSFFFQPQLSVARFSLPVLLCNKDILT